MTNQLTDEAVKALQRDVHSLVAALCDSWDERDRLAAELDAAQQREAGLREALEFYGDKKAWTEPPVEVLNGEFGPAYRNQASEVRKDRGSRARAALSHNGRKGE